MAEEEDLEQQLATQLGEQQDALGAVVEALQDDREGAELLEMKAALEEGIADTQAALLEMKRSRLLGMLQGEAAGCPESTSRGRAADLEAAVEDSQKDDEQPCSLGLIAGGEGSIVGRRCLFRHTDGRWYDGVIHGSSREDEHHQQQQEERQDEEGPSRVPTIAVDFLRPTRPHQLALVRLPADLVQLRGFEVPQEEARALVVEGALEPGVVVLARLPDSSGLWGRAEVVAADHGSSSSSSGDIKSLRVKVVFQADQGAPGGEFVLGLHDVSMRLHPRRHPDKDPDIESRQTGKVVDRTSEEDEEDEGVEEGLDDGAEEDSSEEEEEQDYGVMHRGLGRAGTALARSSDAVQMAAAAGPQTDVAHFADWEGHTRGMASKMMAAMGYVTGRGLGRSGSGMALPLEVRLLQPGKGLGADEGRVAEGHGKKRKRGGARARKKRHADRSRAAKESRDQHEHEAEMATGTPGIFSFINSALGDASEAAAVARQGGAASNGIQRGAATSGPQGGSSNSSTQPTSTPTTSLWDPASIGGKKGGKEAKAEAREAGLHLMGNQDKILQIQGKLSQLQEMRRRNAHDKVIRTQVDRKISDMKAELSAAEGTQRHAESRANDRAKMKKWMKF